ncbi:hypothetical protein CLOSPO_01587 [Clostridium sporogenes ATCC 15579]|nr:hypothetical protein CLOSPO_01587 [Clostridium sporogenes ATCC 15579]
MEFSIYWCIVLVDAIDNLRLEIETLKSLLMWLRTELKNT